MTLRQKLLAPFGIDLRTLALFRAGLGTVILLDLVLRSLHLEALYTDWGVLPRATAMYASGAWRISLYLLNGTSGFVIVMFLLEAILALCLLAGYRTRLMTILLLLMHGSLVNRNPLTLIGGDSLICCLLFWSMFLPLNARWSVDAALASNPPPKDNQHLSWASAGLLIQVVSVYFFSALLKTGPEWIPEGNGLYYAMSLESYSSNMGQWLLNFPELMHDLSYYVWILELGAWALIFSPVFNKPLRFMAMLMLMSMHIGFLFFMSIVPFPYISLVSLTTLLGGWFWDWQGRRAARNPGGALHIYYDRDCGFCIKMCLLLQQFLILPRAQITPAQDTPRAKTLLEANNSWVIIDTDGQAHMKWAAFATLLKNSPLFGWTWRIANLSVFQRIGNAGYDFVARHRPQFARVSSALLPHREVRYETGALAQKIAAAFLFILLAWNFSTVDQKHQNTLAQTYTRITTPLLTLIRIDQIWDMFAPAPLKDNGWFVVPGELENGTAVNVINPDQEITYEKPPSISNYFGDLRWKTYMIHLWFSAFAEHRQLYASWVCRSWNKDAAEGQHLKTFKLIYMLKRTPPPGVEPKIEQHVLWMHDCMGTPKKAAP